LSREVTERNYRKLVFSARIVEICRKLFKAGELLPDIGSGFGRSVKPAQTLAQKWEKEDTGLRCGGRGKSEISSAL